jgi:hypothetical protein
MGRRQWHRYSYRNANPLTDFIEEIAEQLKEWLLSLVPDVQPGDELDTEDVDYFWAVWLPEAVKFGLYHGLKMTANQTCTALITPIQLSEEERDQALSMINI